MLLICLGLGPVFLYKVLYSYFFHYFHIWFIISLFLSLEKCSLHFNFFHYFFLSFVYLYLSVAGVVIVVTVLLYIIHIAFLFSRMLDWMIFQKILLRIIGTKIHLTLKTHSLMKVNYLFFLFFSNVKMFGFVDSHLISLTLYKAICT